MNESEQALIMASQVLHLGLIGYPLGHSLSPLLHHAALTSAGLPGEYRLHPIPPFPEGAPALQELLEQMRDGKIQGLNITIPHKQSVMAYLDELTPTASAIGAVNTIFTAGSQLVGDNTDAPGFKSDLYSHYDITTKRHAAIIIGAGGAARAVVYALLMDGWQITVAARRIDQAHQLTESLKLAVTHMPLSSDQVQAAELSPDSLADILSEHVAGKSTGFLIVNTTPVGMAPQPDACPWPENIPFPEDTFIYDLVYNPADTALLQLARQQGMAAAGGLGMLIEQAALSFERWTGQPASREAMISAASEWVNRKDSAH